MSVCLNHPDVEAVSRCAACGKPICEKCIVACEGKNYCSEKCHENGLMASARSGDVIERKHRADGKGTLGKLIRAVIILGLVLFGVWYYLNHKRELDAKANSLSRELKSKSGEVIEQGRKAIPSDSKYKREKENLVK